MVSQMLAKGMRLSGRGTRLESFSKMSQAR
jgi:hypothetical protein